MFALGAHRVECARVHCCLAVTLPQTADGASQAPPVPMQSLGWHHACCSAVAGRQAGRVSVPLRLPALKFYRISRARQPILYLGDYL